MPTLDDFTEECDTDSAVEGATKVEKKKNKHFAANTWTNMIKVDGATLTDVRIAAEKSLDEVASWFPGMNKSSVSRWEQGILTPSEDRILKLVQMFGTSEFVIENGGKLAQIYVKEKLEGENGISDSAV